jgi:hypothetical protein
MSHVWTRGEYFACLILQQKGYRLDTEERFYIFKEATTGSQLNDGHTVCSNKIIEIIINKERHQHNTPTLYPPNILLPSPPPLMLTLPVLSSASLHTSTVGCSGRTRRVEIPNIGHARCLDCDLSTL